MSRHPWPTFSLLCIAGLLACSRSATQRPPAETAHNHTPDSITYDTAFRDPYAELEHRGAYIDSVFRVQVGEPPRMGWFVKGQFLADESHPQVSVLSLNPQVIIAHLVRVADASEHAAITRENTVACDDTTTTLGIYDVNVPAEADLPRALYVSRPLENVRAPRVSARPLTAAERASARARLNLGNSPAIFSDTALAVPGTGATYAVAAAYDSSSHELLRSALLLMDSAGAVVASKLSESADFECDGCGAPMLETGIGYLYRILNVFVIPGFQHPVLLLDTSTIEGQALSLVTFTPTGAYSEYRIYEYVVNCVLGH